MNEIIQPSPHTKSIGKAVQDDEPWVNCGLRIVIICPHRASISKNLAPTARFTARRIASATLQLGLVVSFLLGHNVLVISLPPMETKTMPITLGMNAEMSRFNAFPVNVQIRKPNDMVTQEDGEPIATP